MSTLFGFSWLPNVAGLIGEPKKFRGECYNYYGGNAHLWGGWMDSCEVGAEAYALAINILVFVGTLASVVGGYIALECANNAQLEVPSNTNPEKPALTLR
ncbi:hypothetical protein ELY21_12880 [Legionella sp. km535]|uniref:hypothetical protein n=1 Tax=Legionella sp. km535 TaxID=2498107 RepID=UPI000F8D3214|nr:hypothetical protein [Legionella sp. km535]RUR16603.1 hypothetical protein ELY21_12880 [Legionella sp. km535]